MIDLRKLPVANILTVGRMALTPLFLYFLLTRQGGWAMAVFFLGAASDALDGFAARRLDQVSRFGAMADPLADKILILSTFAILGFVQGRVSPWLAGLLIARDALMFAWVLGLQAKGYPVTACLRPTMFGKLSTASLMLLLMALLAMDWPFSGEAGERWLGPMCRALEWLSVGFVLAASVSYLVAWPRLRLQKGLGPKKGEDPQGA